MEENQRGDRGREEGSGEGLEGRESERRGERGKEGVERGWRERRREWERGWREGWSRGAGGREETEGLEGGNGEGLEGEKEGVERGWRERRECRGAGGKRIRQEIEGGLEGRRKQRGCMEGRREWSQTLNQPNNSPRRCQAGPLNHTSRSIAYACLPFSTYTARPLSHQSIFNNYLII
ncbi:hypothetical protein Pcinc_002440 [Petrolisthes cinctipes]|uniref:Uncharacterized protein n=1 Tax=Petrolisthes cinctipes TaxID=88211 RepID=A0AAE1L265_PETCI|nr:hypothetical protein Pcinc_002440 [Petrolisthes cinctipes]